MRFPYLQARHRTSERSVWPLSTYPNLEWIAANLEIAAMGAQIRETYRLHTSDALHAATAVYANATALLTNDPIFKRVPNLEVIVLDDYL